MHLSTPFSAKILFPLTAMLAVLTTSSMAVTVIAVLAPAAAPEIGVDATRIGDYTAIVYLFATLSGAVTGAFVGRFGAIRVCQITMLLAALAMLAFTRGTLTWVLASGVILGCAYGPFNPASAHVLWRLSTPQWRPFVFSLMCMRRYGRLHLKPHLPKKPTWSHIHLSPTNHTPTQM